MSPARVAYGPVDEPDGRVTMSNSINGSVVDNAIYVDGVRTANPVTLDETYELLRERHGMAWIGLYRPDFGGDPSVARRVRAAPSGRRGCHRGPPTAQAGAVRRNLVYRASSRPLSRRA